MSTGEILILGVIAGGTIFLGLPMGRVQNLGSQTRAGLSAFATGILVFLLWDVLSGAVEPIESGLDKRDWGQFAGYAALGLAGFALGYMALVYYAEWMKKRGQSRATTLVGPGAAATDEYRARKRIEQLTPGSQLALLIAVGIGVHNFGEGLAIGQAAANDLTGLAVTLVIGFALHNATEGFGIVGPMAGEGTIPSWRYLALLGAIGGGPTFVGTLIGQAWTSDAVSVCFFAIAAGSILYVVQELFAVNRRYGHAVVCAWLVFAGIVVGFGTDFIISASGI
jgi:ZIP family zinc transporter